MMKDFKKATIYQIYPKSFYDSNDDGFGDLQGVIAKLDYLQQLGIDYIWLTPFYVSPQKDNGYDVADYKMIDPIFGTMADFEILCKEAENREIGIMLDMVLNHTSTKHEWFQKALDGEKKYQDYYLFKRGKNDSAPTNWLSKFGGPAWQNVDHLDMYYLHLFDQTQADLNWRNEEVRENLYDIVDYWMKKGVMGFRFDVINLISKPLMLEDDQEGDGKKFYTDGPDVHSYIKELNEKTFGKNKDIITVGEMSSTTVDNCIRYSNPSENELTMVFNFHHLKVDYAEGEKWSAVDFDFINLKKIFNHWQTEMIKGGGWNALFWCNHDQPRIVSRFGNDTKYRLQSAKMLATTLHMMRGTPYVYQGEEIGMTNPCFQSIDDYRDVESINYYRILEREGMSKQDIIKILSKKSRDNSRTPMHWNHSKSGGFTKATPWIPLSANFDTINVAQSLNDDDSIFHHYRRLILLRKQYDVVALGDFTLIDEEHPQVFAYKRCYQNQQLVVVNHFYEGIVQFELPKLDTILTSSILTSNYPDSADYSDLITLRPYESIIYLISS